MKDKPENPSAFPWEEWTSSINPMDINPIRHSGMTLRDYFAAAAMSGLLANTETAKSLMRRSAEQGRKELAEISYNFAEGMLAARKEGE